jgi:hypothetical protein
VLPILIVTRAWADREGMSHDDIASLLDLDLKGAVQAGDDGVCPRCRRSSADSEVRLFMPQGDKLRPEHAERVPGVETVRCLCGTPYWFRAVHMLNLRDASVALKPHTGALNTDGQEPVLKASSDSILIHLHDVAVEPRPASAEGGTCGPTVVIK